MSIEPNMNHNVLNHGWTRMDTDAENSLDKNSSDRRLTAPEKLSGGILLNPRWILLAVCMMFAPMLSAQEAAEAPAASSAAARRDALRARRMIDSALELLQTGQHDRGVSMLEAVGTMFPESEVRFRAALELGRHHMERREFSRARTALNQARHSPDEDEQAEAWFRLGAVSFYQADYNEAFSAFRRVTNDFPASGYTNHAYDYIGQAHFQQGRWGKAVEAFRMVGTAVPDNLEEEDVRLVEAGQRLFVKVNDRDLRIISLLGNTTTVTLRSSSGDQEEVPLERLGRSGDDWIASVMMVPEPSEPNDGMLTVRGGDTVTVVYIDENNSRGDVDLELTTRVRVVSTGAVRFTDGAYQRSVRGVFAGQPAFLRLVDLDLDVSPERDSVNVEVAVMQKVEREEPDSPLVTVDVEDLDGTRDQEPEWVERSTMRVRLRESAAHSGEFHGRVIPVIQEQASGDPQEVIVTPGDFLEVRYLDELHMAGDEPQLRSDRVQVVTGGTTEPQSIVSEANDPDTQAEKLLIEAKLLHRWGSIFQEVGLEENAFARAEEGLEKIDEIMQITARQSLRRDILEDAFEVRWELYLVQGRLNEAIATCMALVELFPDTDRVDRAFMNIARARAQSRAAEDLREAIRVYRSILNLPESAYQAEAQFRIGEVTEQLIRLNLSAGQTPNLSPAMVEFQQVTERFPHSPFAGEAFKKIINFHLQQEDYVRGVELMDRVVMDYPDAPWLDEILLQWGVAAFRMRNPAVARQKFMQILEEYPNGAAAAQAANFLRRL